MENEKIGAYLIHDTVTGKHYIGSTSDLHKRKLRHESDLRCNVHKNKELQNAFNENNENKLEPRFNFVQINLETREDAFDYEQLILDDYINSGLLFNVAFNARSSPTGLPRSQETRDKISLGHIGKKLSPEHIEKMRLSKIGLIQSEETKEKRRESMHGKNLGKVHTEETKQHLSLIHTGKTLTEEHKAAISLAGTGRINTPEAIENMRLAAASRFRSVTVDNQIYESIRSAAIAFNISDSSVKDRVESKTGKFDNWNWT